jgi:transposase
MTDLATSGATRRLEVLAGPERRRRYSASEKAELVAKTLRPGACAARIARRHGLHPQQLYTWRRQARRGELALRDENLPMFAPVVAEAAPTTPAGPDAASGSGIVVALGDLRLSFGPDVPAGRVAAIVAALHAG